MANILPAEIVEPKTKPIVSVIWLHGLGASGHDFLPVLPILNIPENIPIRFIFPHAPMRSITINGGMKMPAWYDITELGIRVADDKVGIEESAKDIAALIARENALGIPTDRIVLAGFSQGGAMTLYTGLRFPEKMAGLVVLSAYMPAVTTLAAEASPLNKQTPIFMGHGLQDEIVPFMWGDGTYEYLKSLGYPVDFNSYPMHHSVSLEEMVDLGKWFQAIFSKLF